ncbi:MAG TPA: serine/threonine-protein kinase, partial [Candidatus Acidoferrum sp.]|nr:serine/threonine-protein kinase [Candidatus Acidoferrum sp.]
DSTPEADRDRVLREACPDPELRARVLAILQGAKNSESAGIKTNTLTGRLSETSIGPYVVIKPLGSGGMGSVFLVERDVNGIRQRAALKVLAPHAAGPSFVERFYREQRILASLEHPNITRMLDAGLSDNGQPYLVMEYVEGQPLDEFCDARKLGIEARLQLFLKVCGAVDHAHRNLVVHLDLKPSNILVTEDGTPKLLDFGTSKLLHPGGDFTTTISATPSYASPEQLRNEAVTTACDVYSLGVVLFELLTGKRPWGEASIAATIERAIEEREPARPDRAVTQEGANRRGLTESRLRAALLGDLSTILRKSLSARPQDRYASVNELAMDVERYLDGRPVLARPQTIVYRMKKFVRRNRGKVAIAAAMLVALAASLGYAEWRQRQAILEGRRALNMQTFLNRLFEIANSSYSGKPVTSLQDFLKLGVKVLPEYIKDPGDLRQAQLALGNSMSVSRDYDSARQVWTEVMHTAGADGDAAAEAEATAYVSSLDFLQGRNPQAIALSDKALQLSRKSGVPGRVRAIVAVIYAVVREESGVRTDENIHLLDFAVREARESGLPPHEVGLGLYYYGFGLMNRGKLDDAAEKYNEALRAYSRDPVEVCDEINVYAALAFVSQMRGNAPEAASYDKRAYDDSVRCRGPEDQETLRLQTYWANTLIDENKADEALPVLEGSLPLWRKTFTNKSSYPYDEYYALARAYIKVGRYKDAEAFGREALALMEPQRPATDWTIGTSHSLIGQALAGEGRYTEAVHELELAESVYAANQDSAGHIASLAKLRGYLDDARAKAKVSNAQDSKPQHSRN